MFVGDEGDLGGVEVDLVGEFDLSRVEVTGIGLMGRGEGDLDVEGEGRVEGRGEGDLDVEGEDDVRDDATGDLGGGQK